MDAPKLVYVFLADGFEEVEALTPVDVLRRSGANVKMVSVSKSLSVIGAHQIEVKADCLIDDCDFSTADLLVLPGGMPGTNNLAASVVLKNGLRQHHARNKPIGAICAAPSILGEMGILDGHTAVCYPGYESRLVGAKLITKAVVVSLPFVTAKGAGASFEFALELVALLSNREIAKQLAKKMMCEIDFN